MTPSLESVIDFATRCARFAVLVDPDLLERALDELEHAEASGADVVRAKGILQATLNYRRAIEDVEAGRPVDPTPRDDDDRPTEVIG